MKKLIGTAVLATTFGCSGAMATLLDFTDEAVLGGLVSVSGGYSGTTSDGIGFGITSSVGAVTFNQNYDGSQSLGCGVAQLACDKDGVGINNDEISGISTNSGQVLSLAFDDAVLLEALYFLDLYRSNKGTEQARITVESGGVSTTYLANATQTSGKGGYASYNFLAPVLAQSIQFTAFQGSGIQDDRDNDFSLAAVDIRKVPVDTDVPVPAPATLWLIGLGLIGLASLASRRKTAQ